MCNQPSKDKNQSNEDDGYELDEGWDELDYEVVDKETKEKWEREDAIEIAVDKMVKGITYHIKELIRLGILDKKFVNDVLFQLSLLYQSGGLDDIEIKPNRNPVNQTR